MEAASLSSPHVLVQAARLQGACVAGLGLDLGLCFALRRAENRVHRLLEAIVYSFLFRFLQRSLFLAVEIFLDAVFEFAGWVHLETAQVLGFQLALLYVWVLAHLSDYFLALLMCWCSFWVNWRQGISFAGYVAFRPPARQRCRPPTGDGLPGVVDRLPAGGFPLSVDVLWVVKVVVKLGDGSVFVSALIVVQRLGSLVKYKPS